MLVRTILTIACLIFWGGFLPAQTSAQREWAVAIGYNWQQRQDLVFSPFIQKGGGPQQISLSYARHKKWQQTAQLCFAQTTAQYAPTFRYGYWGEEVEWEQSVPHQFTQLDLSYALGRVVATGHRHQFSVGAALAFDLDALTYNNARAGHFGYFMALDAAVWGQWTLQMTPKDRLSARVQGVPVGWVARSPYLINDDDFIHHTASHRALRTLGNFFADGALYTLNHYQRASLTLRYDRSLKRRWAIGLIAQQHLLHHASPLSLRVLQQAVQVQVSRSF